jgi:hypothetical protein
VQSILAMMRLDRVFESYADVAEAVQAALGHAEWLHGVA